MQLTIRNSLIGAALAATALIGSASLASADSTAVRYGTENVDGHKIFYREAGDPAKPSIVLLHGFPSSSHQYRNLIRALTAELPASDAQTSAWEAKSATVTGLLSFFSMVAAVTRSFWTLWQTVAASRTATTAASSSARRSMSDTDSSLTVAIVRIGGRGSGRRFVRPREADDSGAAASVVPSRAHPVDGPKPARNGESMAEEWTIASAWPPA